MEIVLSYQPRWYQKPVEDALLNGKKRIALLWHRRMGKDISCLNLMVLKALEEVGTYYYFFPSFKQARRVIWDGIDESGKSILKTAFPDSIIASQRQDEMKIKLINGSIFQIVGNDNYDSIAGTNPRGCVFSEYALQDPRCWELIVSPILLKNGGWAIFNSTPRGRNHWYDMWSMAETNPHWFTSKMTVRDTKLITEEQLDEERVQGRSEEYIQQEFYVSFNRGIEGSYYGKLLDRMQQEKRICNVSYDPALPVNTAWDIGVGDSNAIVFYQIYPGSNEIHIIDYYETNGESLTHEVKHVQSKEYLYGEHWAPHDIRGRSKATGMSLLDQAKDLGLKFNVVLKNNQPVSLEYGIEAVRATLPKIWIDQTRCARLIKCLESYHKKYNDKMCCYADEPVHDWASHGADAVRMLCVSLKLRKDESSLTPEDIENMRRRAGLYF